MVRTPLRVSFLGGGSDYPFYADNGHIGCVLSGTIDHYVYALARRRRDGKILAHYSGREEVEQIEDLQNEYIRESLLWVGWEGGIEVSSQADIGANAGLGGSSAFLVALLRCLKVLQDDPWDDPIALAEEAFRLESGPLGRKVGRQDHYAAALGGLREYHFAPEGVRVMGEIVAPWFLEDKLLLLRVNGRQSYGEQILQALHDEERNGGVIELNYDIAHMAFLGAQLAMAGDWHGCLSFVGKSWEIKKRTSPHVSNPALDAIYDEVIAAGAHGGKICGMGGGGHFLFYCPDGKEKVLQGLGEKYRDIPFRFADDGVTVMMKV